jgi:carbonic anhydrase/acetyltransferase-like protein (isoleucine patch superfamily)
MAMITDWNKALPDIHPSAFIAPGAVVVGDVKIGARSSVWFGCIIRGDDHSVTIGDDSNLQDGTIIHVSYQTHPTTIGSGVTVGHAARLHGCTLEDGCLVGIGAIVLDGAVVEAGAMVAAGALVPPNKRVPSGEIWAGNPAKLLRVMTEADREFLRWDSKHYVGLGRAYLAKF